MKNYFALQSLGDNLISLYILTQLKNCDKLTIIGTQQTLEVAKLMGVQNKINVEVIFNKIPSFYNVKNDGFFKAIKDIYKLRQFIKRSKVKELIFEKNDFRISLFTFLFFGIKKIAPNIDGNVYHDRKILIEKTFNQKITLNPSPIYIKKTKNKILISPVTSVEKKNISVNHLNEVILILRKNLNNEITLLDYSKKYKSLKDSVDIYLTDTKFSELKSIMLDYDFYIGADSFLVHLAYFCNIPFFILFNELNKSFLPTQSDDIKNFIVFEIDKNFKDCLKKKFKNIGLI